MRCWSSYPRRIGRLTAYAAILTASVFFAAGHATAQIATADMQVSVAAGFESYRFGAPEAANLESISLLSLPFSAHAALPAGLSLDLRGAVARATLVQEDGTEFTLSGLTDTEVALNVTFALADATATITGIAVAPTGNSRHDQAEARIAGLIASELFPFRITSWGTGGGGGLQASFARPLGAGGSVGVGVGYIATREFEPIDGELGEDITYRPGNQLQVRLAADRNLGNAAKLSFALAFQRHDEDQLDGSNLYRAGNRIQGVGSYAFVVGSAASGIVYAGGLHSEQGVAIQELAHDHSSRTLFLGGGGMRLPYAGVVVLPSIDTRVFRRGSGSGQGYLVGVGASVEMNAGVALISPNARLRLGNLIVDSENETGITGFDLGLAVRFGGAGL